MLQQAVNNLVGTITIELDDVEHFCKKASARSLLGFRVKVSKQSWEPSDCPDISTKMWGGGATLDSHTVVTLPSIPRSKVSSYSGFYNERPRTPLTLKFQCYSSMPLLFLILYYPYKLKLRAVHISKISQHSIQLSCHCLSAFTLCIESSTLFLIRDSETFVKDVSSPKPLNPKP